MTPVETIKEWISQQLELQDCERDAASKVLLALAEAVEALEYNSTHIGLVPAKKASDALSKIQTILTGHE